MPTLPALDLSTSYPRSGRTLLGGYAWLARLADKARAEAAGTEGEYIAYCPLSMGYLERVGLPREAFDRLVREGTTDDQFITYFDRNVSPAQKRSGNSFVLEEMVSHLDEQDREEGRA